jgi:hypothetical protein
MTTENCCNNQDYPGAIQLDGALTLNFYSPELPPPPPAPDSGRNIHLVWEVSRYNYHSTDGIRVRITADSATLMSPKVFAYQLLPLKPGDEERVGSFDHVCSPVDLEEYPEDEPIANSRPAWFRLNYVDVLLRSRAEVKGFVQDVTEDVQRLKQTLDTMDDLLPGGAMWFGTPPVAPAAPTGLVTTVGNARVTLGWAAPTNNGGAPITNYLVQRTLATGTPNWITVSSAASVATNRIVTGLTNGVGYKFRVAAVNIIGPGPFVTTSNAVTPVQPAP